MKTTTLAFVAIVLSAPSWAQPHTQQATAGGHPTQAASAEQTVQQPAQPSNSVSEFSKRTATVARQQAESDVQYETRRRVNKAFNRLLGR